MKHLRTIDCLEAEETILGGTPAKAKALLEGGSSPVHAHLGACASCRTLASDLALLAVAEPVRAPAAVCERAFGAASAELRAVRREARRAVRRAALRIALITVVFLPVSLAWAITIWRYGAQWLGPLLPDPALSLVGGAFALFCLAALSALAFTLTLIAGAAAHPPRAALT